jgi:CheY-like chemotaxis protein
MWLQLSAKRPEAQAGGGPTETSDYLSPTRGAVMQILLVDDDDLSRGTIHQMLERAGHQVTSTDRGSEALQMFEARRPDLVVTDLIMPDTDGLELIQALRKLEPMVKILAISGGGRVNANEYLNVARKFGALAVLAKPFSNQELKDAIGALSQ